MPDREWWQESARLGLFSVALGCGLAIAYAATLVTVVMLWAGIALTALGLAQMVLAGYVLDRGHHD